MLVDGNPSFLELASHYLESEGYEVLTADNGEDGVELAEEEDPDLVLLDILMPKLDGWDVYFAIKECGGKKKICFLTSMEETSDNIEKYEIGDYIVKKKPFTKEKLVNRVENVLES